MARPILHKEYLTIAELMSRWEWSIYDLQYITEHGAISVYVRPVALEAALTPLFSHQSLNKLKRCPICATDIHRMFCAEKGAHIRICQLQGARQRELVKNEIPLYFGDMIVLTSDVEEFEKTHTDTPPEVFELLSPDYRIIMIHGEEVRFGDKQAVVAKYLHERSQTDNPWVHGKELTKIAGSASWKIYDLFGKHKNWRKAIKSDGRGYYRFNV